MRALLNSRPWPNLLEITLVVMRIALGVFMLTHGWPKMEMLLEGGPVRFSDPIGIGKMPSLILTVFAELFCSVLLVLGLLTRLAVIPLIITMVVAVFVVHGNHPFGKQEMGLLYLLGYLVILARGSGKFSIDHLIRG
jgi:putative oxidoreductase